MYQRAILEKYGKSTELVGLRDVKEGRLRLAQSRAKGVGTKEIQMADLVTGLYYLDYPEMPSKSGSSPMPRKD